MQATHGTRSNTANKVSPSAAAMVEQVKLTAYRHLPEFWWGGFHETREFFSIGTSAYYVHAVILADEYWLPRANLEICDSTLEKGQLISFGVIAWS
jgi:hypothetical protein